MNINGIILFIGIIFFLWIGRTILIPLLVAVFLWYLINAISAYGRKILPFKTPKEHSIHPFSARLFDCMAHLGALGLLLGLICLFFTQVRPMFSELMTALPMLQQKLVDFGQFISQKIGIEFNATMLPNITKIATNVGTSLATIATSLGMISVYLIFMFVEQTTFDKKFAALFKNATQLKKMRYITDSIDINMKKYLFMKTVISAATGLMSYCWLHMIGLEFAGIWAFIVFIANYIPTIGSFVACSMPIMFSLITAPGLDQPILTSAGLISLQIIFGNILEPRLTGSTLNLSTLAILINLVFWGLLWGVAGMFFSVPLLVATFIITAQFDSTRWIAVLLSADGQIPDKREE